MSERQPCWFCGADPVELVTLYPAEFENVKGKRILKKNAVHGWVCAVHLRHLEAQEGWQERERERRKQQARELKAAQLGLGGEL